MTAAVPTLALRQLARPVVVRKPTDRPTFTPEPQSDRIFITLLSLNFMLLAFFIVLGASASVDKSRARSIVENVRNTFSTGNDEAVKPHTTLLTARQALQAGVSDALADILPAQPRFFVDNSDRTDVTVPTRVLAADDTRDTVYDNVARLLQSAPTGFRYAMLITGGGATSASGKAAYDFAGNLVTRGVDPQDILVGSSAVDSGDLHLSFLVFEGELDDDGEPWSAGILAPAPASARFTAPVSDQTVPAPPAAEEPAPEQPAPEQLTAPETAPEQPAAAPPAADQPAADQPAAAQPTGTEP